MRLKKWAEQNGVHYQTAWKWVREGKMPVPVTRTPTGTILVNVVNPGEAGRTVLYARVSSHDQRGDLDRQVARLSKWTTEQDMTIDEVVTEVGSGMNGRRRRLARILADPTATTLVVTHRDRLARFGVEHLEATLGSQGRRVVVMDTEEISDDLVRDMTEVLVSFCARLYGRRGARNRAEKALRCAKSDAAEDLK